MHRVKLDTHTHSVIYTPRTQWVWSEVENSAVVANVKHFGLISSVQIKML